MSKETQTTLEKVLDWSLSGDTGISSKAMAAHLTGRKPNDEWPINYPHDPDDFGRCARFLRSVPELRDSLPRMAELHPVWAALVTHWDEITKAMEREVGLDWEKGHRAEYTYKLMREIIEPVERKFYDAV